MSAMLLTVTASAYRLAGAPADQRRWFDLDQPVPYRICSVYDEPGISGTGEHLEVQAAFVEWASHPLHFDLAFLDRGLTASCAAADFVSSVTFADPFDEVSPGVLAVTRVYWTTESETVEGEQFWRLDEADIVFAEDYPFVSHAEASTTCTVGADLRGVAAHEVGHFVGLGHSQDPTATMWAIVPDCDPSRVSLEFDDIEGGGAIYPVYYDILRDRLSKIDPRPDLTTVFPLPLHDPKSTLTWTDIGAVADIGYPLTMYQLEAGVTIELVKAGDDVEIRVACP